MTIKHILFKIKKGITGLVISILMSGFSFGQSKDFSGEWVMQIGNGNKNNVRIQQTGEHIIFWLQINDQVMTFSGKTENETIKVSTSVSNRWPSNKRACHEQITAQIDQYPQYKIAIDLEVKDGKIEGTYTYPKNISCEEGISITLAAPNSVKLISVNYVYWIANKKIFKAPTNQPDNRTLIAEGNETMTDLALDKDAKRIYWAEGKHIYSVHQDGKAKQNVTTANTEAFSPGSLVVHNKKNKLIWVEDRKMMSTQLNHDHRVELLEERNAIHAIVIDSINKKMYWLLNYSDKIRRANLDGTEAEDFAVDDDATDLAIDTKEGYLYWTTHVKIRRVKISSPRIIEDLVTGLISPYDIFIDTNFKKIYWSESSKIFKANLDGKRKEIYKHIYGITDLAIASNGPSSYEDAKIEGSLMIKEAVASKSLLQELIKNDTYYQVLLSEYEQQESEFNLTDARLLLIWGKNFPQRLHRGNNIVFTSSDAAIKYQEYDTWNYKLDDLQKETYSNYPLWLTKNSGLKTNTWNITWKKVKDSFGEVKQDSIKKMDYMLVLATPKEGVLPGLKSFTMNDAGVEWHLSVGNTKASMRFLRKLPNGEEETINNLYAGDPFYIEVNTSEKIDLNTIDLSYFVNNQPLQTESVQLTATRYGRSKKTYRTPTITLQEFSENRGQLQAGMRGNVESVCKIGSIFRAVVTNNSLFNNGNSPSVAAPLINPTSSIWHQALGEAIILSDLSIAESEWERSISKPVETFTNMDITAIPSGGITSSCSVTLGDYAAMLLLKKYFVKQIDSYYQSLNRHKNDEIFQYGFWEMMAPQMASESFPLGNIEVTDDEVLLRKAFLKDYILEQYSSPEEAKKWIKKAKKEGFVKYVNSVKKSLDAAKNLKDSEIKKLLDLTGFGFKSMITAVTSDLQMKKYPAGSDIVCEVVPHIWEPDNLGRSSVKTMNNTAEHCRANEDLQAAGTDVLLATASLLVFPIGAYGAYGKVAAAVYGAALGSGEIARDNIKFNTEDNELDFSAGAFAVLGTERYTLAKLKVTPTWARMLSYFGGGLGVAGDAFDILKFVGKVDMASVYARLPSLLSDIDSKGALDAYKTMNQNNKARFLLLLGEAEELKKIPAGQLTNTQKRLLSVAEQFADELDTAAKSKKAISETGEAAANLSEGLPSNLKDKVPIIKDGALPGNTVRLEYELDANGFLTHIKIRAGKLASAQNIAEHVPALTKMKEYEAVASRAGNLYRKIRHWYRRAFRGEPPLGSPAWESMQEIQKLNFIIDNRLSKLVSEVDAINPRIITEEIQHLTRQLASHQRAFEEFVTNPALAKGFVAMENVASESSEAFKKAKTSTRKMLDDLAKTSIPSNKNVLCAQAKRIKKALELLDTTNPKFLDDLLTKAVKRVNSHKFSQLTKILEGIAQVDNLSPSHFRGMTAFLEASDDMEALGIILQRGRSNNPLLQFHKAEVKIVLNQMEKMSQNTDALKGMASYMRRMGLRVGTVDKLSELIIKTDVYQFTGDLFEVVHKFKNNKGFVKVLRNLSKKSDAGSYIDELDGFDDLVELGSFSEIAFRGALGQIYAAMDLIKRYSPDQLSFEFNISSTAGKTYRNVDILVRDTSQKVIKMVECKEYSKLEGLFKFDIKRQFAKDILIAHANSLSITSGIRWMVSKQVLKAGNEAAQIKKLKEEFLKIFDNQSLKEEIFCQMPNDVARYRKEVEDNFEEIFKFF